MFVILKMLRRASMSLQRVGSDKAYGLSSYLHRVRDYYTHLLEAPEELPSLLRGVGNLQQEHPVGGDLGGKLVLKLAQILLPPQVANLLLAA